MLVGIVSDVHLEIARGNLVIPECDLLILAGDIINARNSLHKKNYAQKLTKRYAKFFENCQESAKNTVIIAGNHEHYGSVLSQTSEHLNDILSVYHSIHFLNNQCITIDDLDIFGCTLWTDMKQCDPLVMQSIYNGMNDYHCIYKTPPEYVLTNIFPEDILKENKYSKQKINEFLSKKRTNNTIIVSHHAPTWACIDHEHSIDMLSYAYANTDLDDMILDEDGPDYWIHGHTHQTLDFMHGEKTRIICNARGYHGYESRANTVEVKLITI
jgi:DNA repair exonuclease SbcCD nuclease subunit